MKTDIAMHKLLNKHEWLVLGKISICEICGKVKDKDNATKEVIKCIREFLSEIAELRAEIRTLQVSHNIQPIDGTTHWTYPEITTTYKVSDTTASSNWIADSSNMTYFKSLSQLK